MEVSAAVTIPSRRLGKLPPKFDARTLRIANYRMRRARRPAPKHQNRTRRVIAAGGYPMHRNNELGDCTCVTVAHFDRTARVWGRRGVEGAMDDAAVVSLYSAACGYVEGSPSTDNGGYLLDVLKEARKRGLIHAFAAIDASNDEELRFVIDMFGGAAVGMMLPVSAQAERVWTATSGVGSEPWSWGGHATYLGDYKKNRWVVATWAELQEMTDEWRDRYMDEAFAVLDVDWIRENGKSVKGFDLAALERDLADVTRD